MKGRMAKTIKEIADNCGVPEQTVRGWCRRYCAVYTAYAKACASERIVNNQESQTFNRGRFNRC